MAAAAISPEATPTAFMGVPEVKIPEHQLPYADGGSRRTNRKQRRQKHTSSCERDSSSSDSSEPEDDSWTRWEGLRSSFPTSNSTPPFTLAACGIPPQPIIVAFHRSGTANRSDIPSQPISATAACNRLAATQFGVSGEAANHLSLFLTTPGSSISANQVLHKIVIVDQSEKGHHISKTKSRVHGALLASRGIVAAYPKAVKLSHLQSHAKHYLLHDTLLIRATVQIVRSWAYDVPPAVTYQSEYYPGVQPDMPAAASHQRHEFEVPQMPHLQQW